MKKRFTLITTLLLLMQGLYSQDYINESFATDIPATWSTSSESDVNPWFWTAGYNGTQTIDGTPFVMVDSDDAGSGGVDLVENLDTPGFDASAGNIIIVDFDQYFNQLGNDEVFVQVWDGSVWNTAWSYAGPTDLGSWSNPNHQTIIITDLVNPSGDTKVRFRYIDGASWAWWWAIDNVVVSSVDCLEPQQLAVSQLGAISTQVTWNSGSGNSNLAYGPTGFDINDIVGTGGTLITSATSPYDISGLDPETSYEFYVQDDCGVDGISGWSGPVSFTTTIGCPVPVFTAFSDPATNGITISFNQGFGDVYIIYGAEDFILGTGGDTTAAVTSPYTITGLDPLTFYDIYLFMDCEGDGLGFSDNTGPFTFNTLVDGPGTNCADPIILNNNLPYVSPEATICGYGNNIGISNCFPFTTTNEEILFAYSPETDDEVLAISLENLSGNYAFISVLDGCPDDVDASCIASIQSNFGETSVLLDGIDVLSGEIYYIMISTYSWNPCLTFDLSINLVTCPTPSALSAVSNSDGSAELNWTSNSGAAGFQLEWGIAGFEQGTGTVVDGDYGVDGPPFTIEGLTSENNYEFYITDLCDFGSISLPAGPFEFSGPPPANDLCADAISIECGDVVTGNTAAATITGNPTAFCGTGLTAASVWYTFIGTGDDITLNLCGSDYDTKIHLFSGTCTDLVCVGGNDDNFANCPTNGLNSYLYASTEVGVTYYVIVSGFSSNTGIYNLEYNCITCPLISGLTVSVTDVSANVNWTTSNDGADYFIEYGPVGFTPGTGTIISGVVGTDGPADDITGLTAGTSYDVYVHEECSAVDITNELFTTFTTNLLPPPANDLCSDAILLNCGDTDSGSTVYATQIGNPAGSLCGFMTLNSNAVWYEIVGNGQLATVTTCGSDFDTELFVFTGTCDELTCYVGADGNNGGCTSGTTWGPSIVEFLAEEGVTYYVAVAGWSAFYTGNYEISYECDPCGDPSGLAVSTTDVTSNISWSSYIPGASYTLVYGEAGFDWVDGTTVSGVNTDLPVLLTGLTAATTYDVCIFEYCEAETSNTDTICTTWTTNLLPPPANDDICNAIELVAGEILQTTNLYASVQAGEPVPPATGCQDPAQMGWCNSNISNSTWYSFTPEMNGMSVISTCFTGSYDTQLAVYTGDCNDLSSLVLVAANDDQIGGCSAATFASTVSVCLEGGVTYYIQVDPYSSFGNGANFPISVEYEEAAIINLIDFVSSTDITIDWEYFTTSGTDTDFWLVYTNVLTGDTGSYFGNTADLPIIIDGLEINTEYEYSIYCIDDCNTLSGPNYFITLSIGELAFGRNINIYPNPVLDKLTIEINAEIKKGTSISILNMQGQYIYQNTINDNVSEYRSEIDMSNYARGVYMLKVEDENASIQKRIIVQ